MIVFAQLEKLQSLLEKKLLFKWLFFILLPMLLYVDFVTFRTMGAFYIIIMLLSGLAFYNIVIHLTLSGMMTFTRFYFGPLDFPGIGVFLSQWISYFLISFVMTVLLQRYIEQKNSIIQLTSVLAKSLDSRDVYTAYHSENVAHYSAMIAEEMGFTKNQREDIYIGGLLHDIGKIGVPEAILTKPSRLTNDEYEQIKMHPEIGYNILKVVPSFEMKGVLDIVLYHHERVDGKGYPAGLSGESIPLTARIVGVADAFDAMTTTRAYRGDNSFEYALNELKKNIDRQFDKVVVEAFLNVIDKKGVNILRENKKSQEKTS